MRSRRSALLLFVLLASTLTALGDILFEGDPAIEYMNRPTSDPVSALNQSISQGKLQLKLDRSQGYLRSVLDALKIPVESQMRYSQENTGFLINLGCGPDPGRCTPSNITVKMLIQTAYNMKDFQVFGGPSWINFERFDIEAKVEDSLAEQLRKIPRAEQQVQMRLMIQSLLADRFKLKVIHQTKELPVYALVVAKGGPKLAEAPPPDPQARPIPLPPTPGAGPPTPAPGGSFLWMGGPGQTHYGRGDL